MRRASLLVLTWCAGTALAVLLALQGVALVDSQITDDRASVGGTQLFEPASPTAAPDDSVAQIGAPITAVPASAAGPPGTLAAVSPQLIIVAPAPPVTETTAAPASAASSRPRTTATAEAPPATAGSSTAAPVLPAETTTPSTTATSPAPAVPPAADGDAPEEGTDGTRPRTNRSQGTRSTTTTRRSTTTTSVTTTTRSGATSGPSTRTFASGGGTIGVVIDDDSLALAFARPRPGYQTQILVETSQQLDVQFSSGGQSVRLVVTVNAAGQVMSDTVKG